MTSAGADKANGYVVKGSEDALAGRRPLNGWCDNLLHHIILVVGRQERRYVCCSGRLSIEGGGAAAVRGSLFGGLTPGVRPNAIDETLCVPAN